MADFEDRSGIVACSTGWGRWYQGVEDVTVELDLSQGTKGREVKVDISSRRLQCQIRGHIILKGRLFGGVVEDESTWTIEDQNLLRILLVKTRKGEHWSSLLEDGQYQPDPATLLQMRHKLDLEKLQREHPGLDFSQANLDKQYPDLLDQYSVQDLPESSTALAGDNKTDDEKLLEAASLQQLQNGSSLPSHSSLYPSRTLISSPLTDDTLQTDDRLTEILQHSSDENVHETLVENGISESLTSLDSLTARLAVTDDSLAAASDSLADRSAVTDDSLVAAANVGASIDSLSTRLAAVETDDMKRGNGHTSIRNENVNSSVMGSVLMDSRETDDMKTEPESAVEPVVTDDMKTEENESLETDEEKSGN